MKKFYKGGETSLKTEREDYYSDSNEKKEKKKTGWKWILIVIVCLILIGTGSVGYYRFSHRNDVKIETESRIYIGVNYKTVRKSFRSLGFTNIEVQCIDDLTKNESSSVEKVTEISIDGESPYETQKWYAKNALVMLTYHGLDPARKDDICLRHSAEEMQGEDCRIVLSQLRDAGFKNVIEQTVEDLTKAEVERVNQVAKVLVDGKSDFKKDIWMEPEAEIVVIYHVINPAHEHDLQIPGTNSSFVGENYEEVTAKLQAAGFSNIRYEQMTDVSWIGAAKDGKVEEVQIDGDTSYEKGSWVSPNVEIVITYHVKRNILSLPFFGQNSGEKPSGGNSNGWAPNWWPFH